jgi:hypothetical protein
MKNIEEQYVHRVPYCLWHFGDQVKKIGPLKYFDNRDVSFATISDGTTVHTYTNYLVTWDIRKTCLKRFNGNNFGLLANYSGLNIYIESDSCQGWHASVEAWLVLMTLAA